MRTTPPAAETMQTHDRTGAGTLRTDHLPLTRHELALIALFWTLLALLTVANRLYDPRGTGVQLPLWSGAVVLPFVQSLLWALLTPPIFWLAGRYGIEGEHSWRRLLLFIGAGAAAAVFVSFTLSAIGTSLFPPLRRRGPRMGPPPGGWRPGTGRWGYGPFWIINDVLIYLGVLAAGLARAYSLRYRARRAQAVLLHAQLADARLDALRRQLDPHFLFNTLHAISSLVERDPKGVRRMISRLSDLLRHSIEGGNQPEIPLRSELVLLGRYVDIMQVRFQGTLTVRMDIDERSQDALVPNLMLQPIVENAIKHGIAKLPGGGAIDISASVEGDTLVLRVRNDGPLSELSRESGGEPRGVGLRNTRDRLEQLYGEEERFTLTSLEDGGALAEIRLPFHTRSALPPETLDGLANLGDRDVG